MCSRPVASTPRGYGDVSLLRKCIRWIYPQGNPQYFIFYATIRQYGGYLIFCLFVCMVTDFSAAEKDSCVKSCVRVRLLSTMSFSNFGENWLAGSHGGGITSGMYAATNWIQATAVVPGQARWGFGIGCRGSVGQSELGRRRCLRPYGEICVLQAC